MNSEGIVLVYSLYIEGGVVPIALALEELGFHTVNLDILGVYEASPFRRK